MREFRGMRLCGKYIALDLTKRDRPTRQFAIGVKDRIAGVLPALIDETGFSLLSVFDRSMPIRITKCIDLESNDECRLGVPSIHVVYRPFNRQSRPPRPSASRYSRAGRVTSLSLRRVVTRQR
jgi:hypothetical protein